MVMLRDTFFPDFFWENFVVNSSVMIRKECFKNVGLFDENRDFISVEDYEMWLRVSKEYKFGYLNQALVRYRNHNKGISKQIDNFYARHKKIIEKTIKNVPDIEQVSGIAISRRFSKLYMDYGLDLLSTEKLLRAREKFLISLKYSIFNYKSARNFIKCLLPYWLFKILKRAKGRLR